MPWVEVVANAAGLEKSSALPTPPQNSRSPLSLWQETEPSNRVMATELPRSERAPADLARAFFNGGEFLPGHVAAQIGGRCVNGDGETFEVSGVGCGLKSRYMYFTQSH